MKLFTYIFFLISLNLLAASRPYLICLGQEEAKIHKLKLTGPYYKLNQEMISNLLQLNDSIDMKPEILKRVCADEMTSLAILETILAKKGLLFFSAAVKSNVQQTSMDNLSIEELKARSFKVFINYLTRLQSNFDDPNCLKKRVPEIQSFYENAQHLLIEVGIEGTLDTIRSSSDFFKKLKNLPMGPKCFEKKS
jgi:hypothetical protein